MHKRPPASCPTGCRDFNVIELFVQCHDQSAVLLFKCGRVSKHIFVEVKANERNTYNDISLYCCC